MLRANCVTPKDVTFSNPINLQNTSFLNDDSNKKFMNISSYGTNVQVDTVNYGLLQAVVLIPGAIGYIAHDYVNNEVKVLSVNGITPTQQTVQNESYPLIRNLTFLKST